MNEPAETTAATPLPTWRTIKVPRATYERARALRERLRSNQMLFETATGGRIDATYWQMTMGDLFALAIDRLDTEVQSKPVPKVRRKLARRR